jgi:DNA-binding cell septation regulator SpoVG
MFSFSVNVRRINSSTNFKGVASIIIDDLMEIDGFKIINGRNGLFVSMPSHKGEIMEDGVKVEKYFDDIRFKGEEGLQVSADIKQAILNAYNNAGSASGSPADVLTSKASPKRQEVDEETTAARKSTAASAKANATTTEATKSTSPRERKPLWGY